MGGLGLAISTITSRTPLALGAVLGVWLVLGDLGLSRHRSGRTLASGPLSLHRCSTRLMRTRSRRVAALNDSIDVLGTGGRLATDIFVPGSCRPSRSFCASGSSSRTRPAVMQMRDASSVEGALATVRLSMPKMSMREGVVVLRPQTVGAMPEAMRDPAAMCEPNSNFVRATVDARWGTLNAANCALPRSS
jgi:hypothetical protein